MYMLKIHSDYSHSMQLWFFFLVFSFHKLGRTFTEKCQQLRRNITYGEMIVTGGGHALLNQIQTCYYAIKNVHAKMQGKLYKNLSVRSSRPVE